MSNAAHDGMEFSEAAALVRAADTDPGVKALLRVLKFRADRQTRAAIAEPDMSPDAERRHVLYRLGAAGGLAEAADIVEDARRELADAEKNVSGAK